MYPNLRTSPSNEHQFRLSKVNEIKDNFIVEIKERKLISKYIASFEYFDKSLFYL